MQKYAFLDRDGTLIWEPKKPEGVDPRETFPLKSMSEFKFMNGAIAGMKLLTEKGFKLVMVTNQTFLGTPKNPKEGFDQVMGRIYEEMNKFDMQFEFVMACPHGPDDNCDCRKPKIGGLKHFLEENQGKIDLSHSYMFGDRSTDEEFAKNLGVQFVKIKTNEEFVVPAGIID